METLLVLKPPEFTRNREVTHGSATPNEPDRESRTGLCAGTLQAFPGEVPEWPNGAPC